MGTTLIDHASLHLDDAGAGHVLFSSCDKCSSCLIKQHLWMEARRQLYMERRHHGERPQHDDGYWAQNNPPIQWNRDSTYNPPNTRPEVVLGRFDDNYNGGTFAGAGIPISDDDYKKYMGTWMVFSGQPDPRVASEVLAVCSAGCPDMPDQLYGDCHNTAVFPDDGSHHTTWHIIKENKDVQVAMTCTVPPPVPSCEKTCSQADCASVNQDECADEYKSTCCKPQRGGIGQPPTCVCKEQSLAN